MKSTSPYVTSTAPTYILDVDNITLTSGSKERENDFSPLGVMVFRDGELLTQEPVRTNSFTEIFPDEASHEYCIRVVYQHNPNPDEELPGDAYWHYAMSCEQCATIEPLLCYAPKDLSGSYINDEQKGVSLSWSENENVELLDHYRIYRSNYNNNYVMIGETTETTYLDESMDENGSNYYYKVTAVYKKGIDQCESEGANSLDNPAHDYVKVFVPVGIDEISACNISIYPNPTDGMINVETEGMTHVSILNTIGQVVYDKDVDNDNETIDMTEYESGIYMLKITTEKDIIVRRILKF